MQFTNGGYRAHKIETFVAAKASDDFTGRDLFIVEGVPGVFRRVKFVKKSNERDQADVVAFYDKGMIQLSPVQIVNDEIKIINENNEKSKPDESGRKASEKLENYIPSDVLANGVHAK